MFYVRDSKHIGLNSDKERSKRITNSFYIKHCLLNSLEMYWQECQLTMTLGRKVPFHPHCTSLKVDGHWNWFSSSILSEPMVLQSFLMDTGCITSVIKSGWSGMKPVVNKPLITEAKAFQNQHPAPHSSRLPPRSHMPELGLHGYI